MGDLGLLVPKLAGWLLSPLSLSLCLLLAGAVLVMRRRWRLAMAVLVLALAGLWLAATPWAAETLATRLEQRHTALTAAMSPQADLIVVLGGAVGGIRPPHSPTINLAAASDRVWHAAALYRAGKAPRLLLAGGSDPEDGSPQSEAEAMQEMLAVLGVPPRATVLESRSRTTRQNAEFSRPLIAQLGARRVLLVTSALHMPRAVRVFRLALAGTGVEVVPAVTDVEACRPQGLQWWHFVPDARALAVTTRAWKEHLGLVEISLRERGWWKG